ncbi:MAG: hypothetical protein JETT_1372 [Candidatus Jettenia ecosi]|uniref:Lipoprotein n=1 Tax=Candidatus Jettenia ecosi TaxID=2494326 RepID=A0A533QP52_9BACT|nr:MAG: hypothetical protein JETT_1372 [Candidatus Jettenia ecosi]
MKRKNVMSKNTIVGLACAFLVVTAGCAIDRTMAKRAPAAQSPGLHRVIRPGPPTEKVIIPNLKGEYEMLPTESVVIQLNSAYLSDFQVDIDGNVIGLVENVERQRDLEAADLGYYTSKLMPDVSTNNLAYREITVYPSPSKRDSDMFNINIRNISASTKYTGLEKISSPLTITVVGETDREERRSSGVDRRTERIQEQEQEEE